MAAYLVEYDKWCEKCLYKDKKEEEDPCWDCLTTPINDDSRKPVEFKPVDS